MTQKSINLGTADKGNGDPLRVAFGKVNDNFTELYTALGLIDNSLNLGAFEFTGSTISTTDSTPVVIDQATTITSNLTVGGDILPSVANGVDLGSSTLPWRSLYVSNNTIFLGGTALSVNGAGNLLVNGSLITGGTTSYNDLSDKPNLGTYATQNDINTVLNEIDTRVTTISYNDLLDKPNIADTFSFGVAADDSTQRVISNNELIKFIGAGGITTASDAEGYITITQGSTSSLVNGAYTASLGNTGILTLPNNGKIASGVSTAQVGSTTTIALNDQGTDQAYDVTYLGIAWTGNESVFTTYTAGSTITFANGDVRTINDIQKNELVGFPGEFVIDIYWSASRANLTAFPITLKTSNYAAAYTAPEWQFGTNGSLTFPDGTTQTTATQAFSFSVAADDSTQRVISNNESIKFTGAGGITTASDAEGNITITGSGGGVATGIESETDVSIRVNLTDSTQRRWTFGEDGSLMTPNDLQIYKGDGSVNYIESTIIGGLDIVSKGLAQFKTTWDPQGVVPTGYTQPLSRRTTTSADLFGYNIGVVAPDFANWNWRFTPDGNLEIPGDIKSNNNINIEINTGDSTLHRWQFGEDGILTLPSTGKINNGNYEWTFGSTGALTLPAGGIISEGGGISGAIKLTPAGGANANQALLIYPTAGGEGDHIHLTAGGGTTELYLGNDSRYVKLVNGGDIAVLANNGAVNRVFNWVGQGGWNSPPYTNLATTGGTGTGLTVNISTANGGYIDINAITINNPGTGYTVGDVITINNAANLPGTFQVDIAVGSWTFLTDGSLASNEFKIKTLNGIPTSINNQTNDNQFWDYNYGSNLATTGGSGTGLTVDVSDANNGYASITINTAGTGYTPGDIITVTNGPFNGAPYASTVTFTIGVTGTYSWTVGKDGNIIPPNDRGLQSAVSGNYQSKVTLSPFQILSQARTRQTANYSIANGDFTSASQIGGVITFVAPTGSMTEFFTDTLDGGAAFERTVRINGTGPEYVYNYFNGPNQVLLNAFPPLGPVTSIRFSYTRISKIDINPDEGVFRIESEPGQDIDIQSGSDLDIFANSHAYMTAGTDARLRSGTGQITITTNHEVPNATPQVWQFGNNGTLTLPNGAALRNTVGDAIAFGNGAGQNSQGGEAVAIGTNAGYDSQGIDAVAIGTSAGETDQGEKAVAIGDSAGYINQGDYAVAIGHGAGNGTQGSYAVAIGMSAGETTQAANSIIINATGATLNQTTANTFTVAPIRNISATSGVLQYNASTKEVSYSNSVTAETFNTDQITVVGNRISTTVTNANLEIECNGTGGVVINTVAEATTASTARSAGYLGIPASAVSTSATLSIADAGEHIYVTTAGQTITIPANASVAYPIGTTLTFIAGASATTVLIAITSDTLRLAGSASTGQRTLAANGMATAVKVAATTWYINGTGLT